MNQIQDIALKALSGLDKLIADAPEGGNSQQPSNVASRAILVRESHGWGRKYCEPIESHGEEWLATFEKAKAAVACGGIVAMLGGRGPGKTRMAAEIARGGEWPQDVATYIQGPCGPTSVSGRSAIYRRAMDIFLELREAAKSHVKTSEREVLAKFTEAGLLVIDEFQERGESEWENRMINNLVDKRYAAEKPTIIIANMERKHMGDALGDSIKDRILECGLVLEFTWQSYRRVKP